MVIYKSKTLILIQVEKRFPIRCYNPIIKNPKK
jgi:hypothetical protein